VVRSAFVLGQAHTPVWRLLPLAAIVTAVLLAPAVVGANPSHKGDALRAHARALTSKSHAAALDLYSLDQQLVTARTQLASLEQRAESLRAERASLQHQLAVAKEGTRIAERRIAARLRALYEDGNHVSSIEIVFGAKSLDEALTALDNLDRTTQQDADVLHQFEAAKTRLRGAAARLAAREASLAAATAQARAATTSLEQTRAQRAAYIASLATQRRLTEQQIANVVAQARAAQARTAQLARANAADATAVPVPATAASVADAPPAASDVPTAAATGRTITVTATGYSLGGSTATGLPVGWGVAAVDPSVIPLGTHMDVPGYGEAVAADTGGAVVGSTIDLWFPTVEQANAWGRRTVTIVLH
jgi:3D (Asp-Asp-Asp) domain-containing protein